MIKSNKMMTETLARDLALWKPPHLTSGVSGFAVMKAWLEWTQEPGGGKVGRQAASLDKSYENCVIKNTTEKNAKGGREMGNGIVAVMEQWVTKGTCFCFSFFKMELLKHFGFVLVWFWWK